MNKLLRLTKLFALLAFLLAGASTAWADTESTILTLDFSSTAATTTTGAPPTSMTPTATTTTSVARVPPRCLQANTLVMAQARSGTTSTPH